jgi:hypothetical protein
MKKRCLERVEHRKNNEDVEVVPLEETVSGTKGINTDDRCLHVELEVLKVLGILR